MVRTQQMDPHQTVQPPQTESRLSATAHEFHPVIREKTETQEQMGNAPQAQDRLGEDFVVGDEQQMDGEEGAQGDPETEEDGNQVETETVRRSQRTARPRETFTYNTLGQPSYQQWNVGVNSLLPSHASASFLRGVPL